MIDWAALGGPWVSWATMHGNAMMVLTGVGEILWFGLILSIGWHTLKPILRALAGAWIGISVFKLVLLRGNWLVSDYMTADISGEGQKYHDYMIEFARGPLTELSAIATLVFSVVLTIYLAYRDEPIIPILYGVGVFLISIMVMLAQPIVGMVPALAVGSICVALLVGILYK